MLTRIKIRCLAILLAGWTTPARADLSIFLQDTTVAQGGTGVLNIYLSGTSTDTFNDYQFQLQITGPNQPPDLLEMPRAKGIRDR